jgi:murein DD-endopeptidase MepM/ murein hydrolase activator NlpD
MANIIGEPFSPWVKTQIEKRQEALGKTNIDPNTLKWVTTKAPWLRLASSVNIDDTIVKKLNITSDLNGSALAKNFILFGGAANESGNLQSGINFSNSALAGEYGWGGIGERGFVPMPGITSADVTYYNNGALAKASVKIKAFSREQFALIDYLYMRPGYSVLLEFGHTVYLDNNGDLQQWDKFQSGPLESFLTGTTTEQAPSGETRLLVDQYVIQNRINVEKERYKGNYEGFIGQISKFSWSFNRDGSYDINIELIAYGSIIESLKMNVVDNTPEDNTTESQTESTEEVPTIVAQKEASKINKWLYQIYESQATQSTFNAKLFYLISLGSSETSNPQIESKYKENIYKAPAAVKTDTYYELFSTGTTTTTTYNVYITLASLLHFIETECGLYDGDSPQVKFDFNYDYFGLTNTGNTEVDRNYFFSPPNQFSADPRVCLIPIHKSLNEIIDTLDTGSSFIPLNPSRGGFTGYYNVAPALDFTFSGDRLKRNEMPNFKTGNANAFVGKMGYILLNIEYLAGVLNSLTKEEDGVATLVKLLQQIMDDVNVCLGGINNFTVYSDRDTQTIRIYDQTPLNYGGSDYNSSRDTPDKFTTLNVFGVRPGVEGSFVQDIQLNSEISPNFSTAISVGAQANSTNVSQNAYSFEKYNKGLTDRIILEKASKNSNGEKYKEGDAPIDLGKFKTIFTEVYGKKQFTNEYIDYLKNANSQANILFTQKYSKDGNIDAPFFIPYNLNVTLDGISGIKLFEKFKMSKGVLPLTYDEGEIALIVKAISHTIDTKQWITKLETLSVPEASGSLKTFSPPPSLSLPSTSTTSTANPTTDSKFSDFTFDVYPNWVPTFKNAIVTATSLPKPGRNIGGEIKNHYGIDIAGAIGTYIISPVDGIVRNGLFGRNGGGFGDSFVIIQENGTRNFHIFGHNESRENNAKTNGAPVKKGDIIAKMGNKGYSTGPHLHYEIRKGSVQTFAPRLDPVKYLNSQTSPLVAAVKKSEKTYS